MPIPGTGGLVQNPLEQLLLELFGFDPGHVAMLANSGRD